MKIVSKEVKIKKSLKVEEIEDRLKVYGNPLRFAIVRTDKDYFYIEASFISQI